LIFVRLVESRLILRETKFLTPPLVVAGSRSDESCGDKSGRRAACRN
jgi:hypothetical protein